MLQLSNTENPISQEKARELLTKQPKITRHTKAWVDDKELCLEVECELNDSSTICIEMHYCWCTTGEATPWQTSPYYFMQVVEWLLNQRWLAFYHWVQVQFDRVLQEQASDESLAENVEP